MKIGQFINNSIKNYGHHQEFFKWVVDSPDQCRLYQPIEIKDALKNLYKNNESLGLYAQKDIKEKSDILMVSTQKCITGLELVGSDRMKSFEINNVVNKVASKYYENNLSQLHYTTNLLKIVVQLFVHQQDKGMQLYPYSSYLQTKQQYNPMYWDKKVLSGVYDSHLASLIASTKNHLENIYKDLQEEKLFGIDYQYFMQLMSIARSMNQNFIPEDPKNFDLNSVVIMCPLIDMVNHEFKPNCKIEGRYYQHESDSYVVLRSIRDIKQGEQLTINYGNFHNYDFLMRYGFASINNKFNEMPISLDFSDFLEYTGQSIPDFSLDKFIIHQNKINSDLLAILRIYFLTEEDLENNYEIASYLFSHFKNKISDKNEKLISEFMIHALQQEKIKCEKIKRNTLDINLLSKQNGELIDLQSLKDLDYISDVNYRHMLQICIEMELIIQSNIQFFSKKLQNLNM
ncbi:hypothetical protein PPERSA_00838 [Pseudocohnilembus persalinus]|uniref:SET domain-containing protein n=1 Tax=Pseudocohnilembus persalinus TaxID=266149 RepID=A0A0V0R770_PSEPJ|nr:hypothetical protein PPERSA_00838 [Pseudocohnilembus persalinus]|eukprot:KRX10358.1 hypothetical protein PPERSA_00838 [Pseudocohnilembus persalinus]